MDKPSLTEVALHFHRIGVKDAAKEAGKFWLYFESKGWKVGKSPMKNWRAACSTWARNIVKTSKNISSTRLLQPCKIVKTESDNEFYRAVEDGKLYEWRFDNPPKHPSHRLAFNNWFGKVKTV